ncbi:diaminopimelate epimerase [Dellaglioa sp. P0083]|uniref:diaminopimelate epimerase n=1 Tax=Dellaglioa kimchii TaxID=3344667 RepID=UPI0038D513ED
MELVKVHGSENDFFLLDQTKLETALSDEKLKHLAIQMCNRESGLHGGSDGILVVNESSHNGVLGRMRVINADGTEASMCGNGLRTVGRYLETKFGQTEFKVETMHADLDVKKAPNLQAGVAAYNVEISPVSFESQTLPMFLQRQTLVDEIIPEFSQTLKFSAVSVPNPHLITFVDHTTLQGPELERIATYLNGENPYFPDGVNVSFVEKLDNKSIFVRTYERGVGFTNACGTAMSASSLMFVLLSEGKVPFGTEINVKNPGGMVKTVVHQDESGNYWMSLIGNATNVANITIELADALNGDFSTAKWISTNEQDAYLKFISSIM